MKTTKELVVPLRLIPDEGYSLDADLSPQLLSSLFEKESRFVPQSGKIAATLFLADESVHVRGTLHFLAKAECGRCLNDIEMPIKSQFEFALFPEGRVPNARVDGEVEEQYMDIATYRGHEIDIKELIRDEAYLAFPMHPRCEDVGLDKCIEAIEQHNDEGTNEATNPLMNALKNIKLPSNNSN